MKTICTGEQLVVNLSSKSTVLTCVAIFQAVCPNLKYTATTHRQQRMLLQYLSGQRRWWLWCSTTNISPQQQWLISEIRVVKWWYSALRFAARLPACRQTQTLYEEQATVVLQLPVNKTPGMGPGANLAAGPRHTEFRPLWQACMPRNQDARLLRLTGVLIWRDRLPGHSQHPDHLIESWSDYFVLLSEDITWSVQTSI